MKLTQISGKKLIRKMCKQGFVVISQKGSHIKLAKNTVEGTIKIIIPNHKTIKKGTLHQILKNAGLEIEDII